MPQSLVKRLLGEASQDMRFDLNARVEVWILQEDLEYDSRILKIRKSEQTPEQKIVAARKVAEEMAHEKLSDISRNSGVEISADFNKESINVDRVDWNALVNPQPDQDEDYDAPPAPPSDPRGQAPGAPGS